MEKIIIDGDGYYLRAVKDDTKVWENENGYDAIVTVNGEILCTIRVHVSQNFGFVDVIVKK